MLLPVNFAKTLGWLLCLVVLTANGARAQVPRLPFAKDSLRQVLKLAEQQQKPVFVLLTAPAATSKNLTKEQLQRRYGSALDDDAVASVLKREFLLVHAPHGSADARQLSARYDIHTYPTYLYLAPDGTALHRSFGTTHDPQRYLRDIASVRQLLASPDNPSLLAKRYGQGDRDTAFLRHYIQSQRRVGAPVRPEVLDAYVENLPAKRFEQLAEVVFVLECGPVFNSRAYKLTHLDQHLIDSLYKTLPLPRRQAINNAIIMNTMQAAIARHDPQLAMQGANFARNTWGKNYFEGHRVYSQRMMGYYRAVHDTTSYLPLLMTYYDQQYMRQSPDTMRQRQERSMMARSPLQNPTPYTNLTHLDSATNVRIERTISPAGLDPYAAELNGGAWAVYTSGTRRAHYLLQAMRWSQRTVALDPRPAYYDTLAHLLYVLNLSAEATAMQEKAVELARRSGESAEGYQKVLRQIKDGTLPPGA